MDLSKQTGFDFVPNGRFGKATKVAELVLSLASEASKYINGAVFSIDDGRLAAGFAPAVYKPILKMEEV
jgi:NAD(P)-dependent dehydrogenase (short-subunit alcohol dehydrogenase family)